MANKVIKVKIKIDSEKLKEIITKKGISIRQIGTYGVYNEKTIRRDLKSNEMTVEIVSYLAHCLNVQPELFADIGKYFEDLDDFIHNWKEP